MKDLWVNGENTSYNDDGKNSMMLFGSSIYFPLWLEVRGQSVDLVKLFKLITFISFLIKKVGWLTVNSSTQPTHLLLVNY